MSPTTFLLLLTFSSLYKPSKELRFNKNCDTKIIYHLIRHSESYHCLCTNKQSQSSNILEKVCTETANNSSWRTLCGVETNRILDCPRPLSEPSGAAIPATSTTGSTVSGGGKFTVYNLQTEENNALVRFLSGLMEHLQPNELPLGLIKDLYVLGMPLQLVSFQVLKMEAFGLFWIFMWFILDLFLPLFLITHFCFAPKHAFFDASSESSNTTKKNLLQKVFIHLLLLSLMATLVLLLYNNQQISLTIGKAPTTVKTLTENLEAFTEQAKHRAISVTTGASEKVITNINQDLDDVEDLLGKPFQDRLTTATGIDVALAALLELQKAAAAMSTQTSDLLKGCETAKKIRAELQDELRAISGQVLMMRYQCAVRDKRLCETLQPLGFNVVFSVRNITENEQLNNLAQLKQDSNLNAFHRLPKRIIEQTLSARADIKGVLEKRRRQIAESVVELEDISGNLSGEIREWRAGIRDVSKEMVEYDFWRWLLTIMASLTIFTTLSFFICGGRGSITQKTICQCCGLASSSITCIFIWLLASMYFFIGGHSYGFLCKPLNDHPQYTSIAKLVDAEGLLFNGDGLWRYLLKRNISVGFAEFLWNCERNESIFDVFNIKTYEEAHLNFTDIEDLIARLDFDGHVQILTAELDEQLQELASVLSVNVTNQRQTLAKPITAKDLNSFLDQLNLVAKRLSDRSSVKRVEDLRSSIKGIIEGNVETLAKLRDEIVFNVTKLEVLMLPLKAELEQTLWHLKTIQDFLDGQAEEITAEVAQNYKGKLRSHLKNFALNFEKAGNCHPLWKIFDVLRYNICDLFTEPMNSLAFCFFFCMAIFLVIAPTIAISMRSDVQETPSMTRRLLADHQDVWTTPINYDSPDYCQEITVENLGSIPHHETVAPLPPPPPPPPRPPSPKTTKYRARTPRGRFESLRQVQPISWKTSLSPANWI